MTDHYCLDVLTPDDPSPVPCDCELDQDHGNDVCPCCQQFPYPE